MKNQRLAPYGFYYTLLRAHKKRRAIQKARSLDGLRAWVYLWSLYFVKTVCSVISV